MTCRRNCVLLPHQACLVQTSGLDMFNISPHFCYSIVKLSIHEIQCADDTS
jgi:hypothetical protein